MADDELSEIRRRRIAEMQRQQAARGQEADYQAAVEQQQAADQEAQRESLLRQILTPEARERLTRLRLARPEDARSLESQLIQLGTSGRLQGRIDDEQLKIILTRLQQGQRETSIKRK